MCTSTCAYVRACVLASKIIVNNTEILITTFPNIFFTNYPT